MAKEKQKLLFVAECTDANGHVRDVSVYRSGRSHIFRSVSEDGHSSEQISHVSVHSEEDIKREIGLVYKVTVTGIKYPHQLNPND